MVEDGAVFLSALHTDTGLVGGSCVLTVRHWRIEILSPNTNVYFRSYAQREYEKRCLNEVAVTHIINKDSVYAYDIQLPPFYITTGLCRTRTFIMIVLTVNVLLYKGVLVVTHSMSLGGKGCLKSPSKKQSQTEIL